MSDEEYVDGYVCGSGFDDAEHASFTDVFETREEAIKAGMDDCGWIEGKMFQTARIATMASSLLSRSILPKSCAQAS